MFILTLYICIWNWLRVKCWPTSPVHFTAKSHLRSGCFCYWKHANVRNRWTAEKVFIVEEWKTNLMSPAILFHFLCAQHVSDVNTSIVSSLRLFCWITTLVVLFLVRCVLDFRCGWVGVVSVLQAEASACNTDTTPTQPHRNSNTHAILKKRK